MTYGEALKSIFEGFFSDRADENKQFIHVDLKKAISTVPIKWKRHIYFDFLDITREIKESILKCPHSDVEVLWDLEDSAGEKCSMCGCTRDKSKIDEYGKTLLKSEWSEWGVY
jgi:hypothetical protein